MEPNLSVWNSRHTAVEPSSSPAPGGRSFSDVAGFSHALWTVNPWSRRGFRTLVSQRELCDQPRSAMFRSTCRSDAAFSSLKQPRSAMFC